MSAFMAWGEDSSRFFGVDVAPGDEHDDRRAPIEGDLAGEERGRGGGPCRLARQLGARVQEAHAAGDLLVADEDDLVDAPAADGERRLAGERRGETVGDRPRL